MVKSRWVFALFLAALIALAPTLAMARAGGSYGGAGGGSFSSMGSMGSRGYNLNGAQPLQRSLTPTPSPSNGQPGYGYGGHPFMSGLAGGFLGSWLGGLLFPHWGMGYGLGFPSVIGSVFSWLFLLGLIWMAFRLFAGGGMRRTYAAPMQFGGMGYSGPAIGDGTRGTPLAITGDDYQAFEAILKQVQAAWSRADLGAMRPLMTPEMLSYFSEQLSENESRGVHNVVDQVELLRGDRREAWDEGRLQYATCFLHWRAIDYTVRAGARPGEPELIVEGDAQHPAEAAEVWTFARTPGGQWLLSAIQQV
ncbi:MAG TPA: TIM44-like domain-containing protein [Stellaceae bacterium]|nr:TIM44-like domain-containing protein [Stellaceae bacterium]